MATDAFVKRTLNVIVSILNHIFMYLRQTFYSVVLKSEQCIQYVSTNK